MNTDMYQNHERHWRDKADTRFLRAVLSLHRQKHRERGHIHFHTAKPERWPVPISRNEIMWNYVLFSSRLNKSHQAKRIALTALCIQIY